MRRSKSLFTRLCIAALVSGLAALLMVTVGPGFAEKPDDLGPNEQAAEQAQEATAEEDTADEVSEGSEEAADEGSSVVAASEGEQVSEVAAEAAANGNKPLGGPPGQTTAEGGETTDLSGAASSSVTSSSANGNPKPNEDTSQTGLPRGESEDECTNKHQGPNPPQGGANQNPGPYDNTCDGRASENGSGGGGAGGRPCMGCVGNADDMNPPGQLPNGKDHNAGYECDRNKGVGQGNPAHTDCQPQPPCEDDPDTEVDECDNQLYEICHVDGSDFDIVSGLTRAQADSHLSSHSGDFEIRNNGDRKKCAGEDVYEICHVDGVDYDIVNGLTRAQADSHLSSHAGDFEIRNNGDRKKCAADAKVWICHATGSATNPYVIINVSANAWSDDKGHGHAGHEDDFEVPAGTTKADCGDDDVVSICYELDSGDWAVAEDIDADDIRQYENARIVPKGTRASNCDEDEVLPDLDDKKVCPKGSELEGEAMPDDKNCNPTVVVTVCPASSDRPMQVLPSGRTAEWCYDDQVQGERIRNLPAPGMPKPNVQPNLIARPDAGILPFTGASVLAFLVLALQLIAAGSLILRGRRA